VNDSHGRLPGRLILLGHPVGSSLSPVFQNAALAAARIPLRYETVDVEPADFSRTLAALLAQHAWGNVTIPHKERMRVACDEVTSLAARVGAVNTFWLDKHERLIGDNTDVGGFMRALNALLGVPQRGLTFGILGAGGAAAAVLAAIEELPGCRAYIYNRTPERARLLSERFRAVAQPVDDVGVIAGTQVVVNATSIGLRDDSFPLDPGLIPVTTFALDLVYRRGETAWVRALRARGHKAADGLTMLIEQGALAFERWFGVVPDRRAMWEAVSPSP
jgi:shikimate dehydrogenase